MAEAETSEGEAAPRVEPKRERGISAVWFAPLAALAIAGWLAWRAYEERGVDVVVTFETATGLEAGKTRVRYRDVEVGLVENLVLAEDLDGVVATLTMQREAAPMLRDGARFWVVRPRVGAAGISGLDTLVSGAFIEIDPGAGDPRFAFEGLEEPPVITSDEEGTAIVLQADELGSIARGSPIYFRGFEVGEILGYRLDDDGVIVFAFVRAPFNERLKPSSRFWNASGISVAFGADGVTFDAQSLQTLVVGGVAFENPPAADIEEPARNNAIYTLFDDRDDTTTGQSGNRLAFVSYFEGSLRGLAAGAPVELRGIDIGRVTGVELEYDAQTGAIRLPVEFEVYPDRITIAGASSDAPPTQEDLIERVQDLVAQGLRAQLATGSILTGSQYIALDFHPSADPAELLAPDPSAGRVRSAFPTLPTTLDTLAASAEDIMRKIAALPLGDIVEDARGVLASMRGLVESPEIGRAIADASRALNDVSRLASDLRRASGPILEDVGQSVAAADAALDQATRTLRSVERSIGADSALRYDLGQLLSELTSAARSIRAFAQLLERNPEALIQGKRGGY